MQTGKRIWIEFLEGAVEFAIEAAKEFLSSLIEAGLGNLL